jgi:thiamine-phosphate pyrophosphorylase
MLRSENEPAAAKVRDVYLLTPDASAAEFERVLSVVQAALSEGVSAIQYRNKIASEEQREVEASRIVDLAHRFGAVAIVNDDPKLAMRCRADGAHIGRDDETVAHARLQLGAALLGISCYAEFERAERAIESGADIIAFGSVFTSPTKPNASRASLSLLTRARDRFPQARVVAIGGIDETNIAEVAAAGAHAAAVLSAVFSAPDPRRATDRLISEFLKGKTRHESQRRTV